MHSVIGKSAFIYTSIYYFEIRMHALVINAVVIHKLVSIYFQMQKDH